MGTGHASCMTTELLWRDVTVVDLPDPGGEIASGIPHVRTVAAGSAHTTAGQ